MDLKGIPAVAINTLASTGRPVESVPRSREASATRGRVLGAKVQGMPPTFVILLRVRVTISKEDKSLGL